MDNLQYDKLTEEQQQMLDLLGEEKYIALLNEFGGGVVYLPTTNKIYNHSRNEEIIKEYMSGLLPKQIARKYGITCNRVYQIVGEARKRK